MPKPDTALAMTQLIKQIREVVPFDIPQEELCDGPCTGCPKKLIEYLDTELEEWESSINSGEVPRLGDIDKLAKTSQKIHRILEKNGLI